MAVEPLPCNTPAPEPEPVTPPCCAPSIASAPLCQPDGTMILAVLRSGCIECGGTTEDPEVIGWLDPATSTIVPGPLPADAGPCDSGCLTTVCRQLCDDTDGDGQADTTYSELWCLRSDGSAELLLTYQDDPSQPYTPVSPVDCEHACPESETVTLCDSAPNGTVTSFLRRYSFLDGADTHEDLALDGTTPYIVLGTVGACETASPCTAQTTPAATLGLCLADGTPIAVVVTRDCEGTVTRDGWLNLTTGAYSTGEPPAGTVACGDSRSIQVSGTFCDVDPDTGDVLGLVLIEYSYDADGSIAAVRLVDAVTGDTYTPQGEVTTCPAGVEQPERDLLQLCDTADDGTVTAFVRDYARDENGQITGHTDYTLDGAPYTPAGTVGVCPAESVCADCTTHILCDVPPDTSTAALPPGAVPGTLSNGVGYSVANATSQLGQPWWLMRTSPITWTFSQPVAVTFGIQLRQNGTCAVLPEGATPVTLAPVHTWNAATRTLCTTAPNNDTSISTFTHPGLTELAVGHSGAGSAISKTVGEISVTPVTPTFERTTCRDCSGAVTSVTDTLLDGITAYMPVGTVGVCQPPAPEEEPCRDSSTVLLCDDPAPADVPPLLVTPAITDTDPTPYFFTSHNTVLAGGGQALWGGGTLTFPAETSNAATGGPQVHRCIAGVLRPAAPACDDGTATVTVEVDVQNMGPNGGVLTCGRLRLLTADGTQLAFQSMSSVGAGATRHLAVSAPVPSAVANAGELVAWIDVETWDQASGSSTAPKSWQARNLVATIAYGQAGCQPPTQFLRTILTDCETGATVSQTDTTLDGQPYTVTGEVGQCQPTGGGDASQCRHCEPLILCDVTAGEEPHPFLRTVCRDCTGAALTVTDTELDGATPYVVAGEVTNCGAAAGTEPCRDTSSTLLCDTAATDLITVFDPATRADADGWEVVSFSGANPGYGPEAAMPYPARYGALFGYPALGARADQNAGTGGGTWAGYDSAPVRWVLRKTFQAPEDGVAVAQSVGFRADGGARVRINGVDAGMYGQWNQPATSGTAQIPVMAGPNTVEIEVRDTTGINNVSGRLDLLLPHTTQFMRRQVVDCETGAVVSVTDTTLDGEPYEVAGEVGQCQTVSECCEQPPPEIRVDVETALLCVRDQASGEITGQVIAERVYDDQSGDLIEQRLTDLTGDPCTLPAGAELTKCPSPDRITRQVCVVESGSSEFLTNAANATSGQDTDWTWAPNLTGLWYPMYRVAPNPAWTTTDTAPNKAHWVSPHSDRTVCPTAGENSPPVPGTWYTRASWNLPASVNPDSIRIAATVLNADNTVVQWRLNDGAWQPVGDSTHAAPAWTFPPTAVPGGRAGQNEVVVQLLETAPAVSCPSTNQAGMLLHVLATYDHEPKVWTQVIEPGGQVYYLDENGTRQDAIPAGRRLVACGGGGDAPCCPAVNTDVLTLCDTATDGTVTSFLRHLTFTEGVAAPTVRDTTLDGTSPYTPAGTVGSCQDTAAGRDVEITPMCVVDNATGRVIQRILAEVTYDTATGDRLSVRYVDPLTWGPVAMPGGTHLDLCPDAQPDPTPDVEVVQLCDLVDGQEPVPFLRHLAYAPGQTAPTVVDTALDGVTPYVLAGTAGVCSTPCDVQAVLEQCRCDDTTGDGKADTAYVELLAVDCDGNLTSIGTYTPGLGAPYTPVAPVDCEDEEQGADPAFGVQAHRVELAPGTSWDADAYPTLQSVTAVSRDDTATVTTADGTSTLYPGEAATWSVGRDVDARLTGPLVITAGPGTVTVTWTEGKQL
ncbi:hypothetical protein ACIQMV_38325 [Streptomyces sp. NPDC091412]|uniref:hypothetical protein n=1 Tax=Streptomyces sp. NPDC091412 TaxID=3366002 RepID=UPI0037FC7BE9